MNKKEHNAKYHNIIVTVCIEYVLKMVSKASMHMMTTPVRLHKKEPTANQNNPKYIEIR